MKKGCYDANSNPISNANKDFISVTRKLLVFFKDSFEVLKTENMFYRAIQGIRMNTEEHAAISLTYFVGDKIDSMTIAPKATDASTK